MLINANTKIRIDSNALVYPELSYKLMGVLFSVHNQLGSHLQEKYYQRAIEEELKAKKINYEKEKLIPLKFRSLDIGRYFLDFVIEEKIALEIKTIDFFKKKEWRQIRNYLKAAKLRLGILVNFNGEKLIYKRILNSEALA